MDVSTVRIIAAGKRSGEHWEQDTEVRRRTGEAGRFYSHRFQRRRENDVREGGRGALVPVLLERHDTQTSAHVAAAGKGKGSAGARGRELGTGPAADRK